MVSSYVHAGPTAANVDVQLLGSSRQTYQSRLGLSRLERDSTNHGWLIARVVGHPVEHDLDRARVAGRDQLVEVGQRAEDRVDVAVVGDVVAEVGHRRGEDRRQPDRLDRERLEVVELRGDPREVPHPVAVRVRERARIDLVDGAALPPGRLRHRREYRGRGEGPALRRRRPAARRGGDAPARGRFDGGQSGRVRALRGRVRGRGVAGVLRDRPRRGRRARGVRAQAARPARGRGGAPVAAAAAAAADFRRSFVRLYRIRQLVVACANSLPPSSAYSRPSAVPSLRPTCTTWLSASTRPLSALSART